MKKILSVILAAALLCMAFGCLSALAKTEREVVIDSYEDLNENERIVHATIWEYSVSNGERGSGKPVEEVSYTEKKTDVKTESAAAAAVVEAAEEAAEETFTTLNGVELTKGAPAAEVLKQVLAAFSEGTEIALPGVDEEVAAQLLEALKGEPTAEELLDILSHFPVQFIDGVRCHVVTLQYADANGEQVTERFAFDAADATLVKAFQ